MEAYNIRLAIQQKLINTHNEELLTKPGLFHFFAIYSWNRFFSYIKR